MTTKILQSLLIGALLACLSAFADSAIQVSRDNGNHEPHSASAIPSACWSTKSFVAAGLVALIESPQLTLTREIAMNTKLTALRSPPPCSLHQRLRRSAVRA